MADQDEKYDVNTAIADLMAGPGGVVAAIIAVAMAGFLIWEILSALFS